MVLTTMKAFNKVDSEYLRMALKTDKRLCGYPDITSKLDDPDLVYQYFVKTLAKCHFELKAISHDILSCNNSIERLNELNELGRAAIREIREEMEKLDTYAKDARDSKYDKELETQRHILAGLLRDFKEANIRRMFAIEKSQREDLFTPEEDKDGVRKRNKKGKVDSDGLLQMSTGVTEQLLSISRQLADTTQRSQDTLDSLVSSSSTVHGTQSELQNTAGSISQSSKLLNKYGRREFTDKVIMFFAFLFFLAVCLYIVQKRMF
ncbi:vesicle transport protein SEC20 [Epargyreus clarus]|uniref:vesicle transport protein SEC20 n=1 Tax=Epargyreus clarus TaxID=520877 RepID=UPI003C302820